jgi:hypothetical protein
MLAQCADAIRAAVLSSNYGRLAIGTSRVDEQKHERAVLLAMGRRARHRAQPVLLAFGHAAERVCAVEAMSVDQIVACYIVLAFVGGALTGVVGALVSQKVRRIERDYDWEVE